jgi:hypothetical protein
MGLLRLSQNSTMKKDAVTTQGPFKFKDFSRWYLVKFLTDSSKIVYRFRLFKGLLSWLRQHKLA